MVIARWIGRFSVRRTSREFAPIRVRFGDQLTVDLSDAEARSLALRLVEALEATEQNSPIPKEGTND